MIADIVKLATKLEATASNKVGLGMHSRVLDGECSHDGLWKAMLKCVREPKAFYPEVKVTDMKNKVGYVQRTTKLAGKKANTEIIYSYEASCEICYRPVSAFGKEGDIERVVALRSHPLQLEFHCRNRKDGFRVDWTLPKEHALGMVDSYVREAKRMDTETPTIIGYGASSDPISGVSYDSLFIAVERSVMQPSLVVDCDPAFTKVQEFDGYVMREYKLGLTGETIREKITIFEEVGEVVFCKQLANGGDGDCERVIAFHTGPLRMELYERNTIDDVRISWKLPYGAATDYITKVVGLAKKVEKAAKDVIGYGISSKPVTGMSPDSMWKTMLFNVRNPTKSGMDVANVKVTDMRGYMQRTMTLNYHPSKPTITSNVYPDDRSREIVYRKVTDGREEETERVFAVRENPLRMEMFSRHTKDRLRAHWRAPRSAVTTIFDGVVNMGQMMHNDPRKFEQTYGSSANENRGYKSSAPQGGYKGYAF